MALPERSLPARDQRPPARTTALAALTLFVPLACLLMWWAFAHRVLPVSPETNLRAVATLPAFVGAIAALFAAAGPAVLTALLIANRARLRAVLRPSRGRILTAFALTLLTPVTTITWLPVLFGWFPASGLLGIVTGEFGTLSTALNALTLSLVSLALATLAWYPAACLAISGVKPRLLRLAVLALFWWSAIGIVLLAQGYRTLDI